MKSIKLSENERIVHSYTLGTPSQAPRYFSLEWTCAQLVALSSSEKADFLLGCGPYIYVYSDKVPSEEVFSFCRQSSIFEATGTFIRGLVDSQRGFFLAWGGSYIARISFAHIEDGATVCPQDILSTGRQIISVRIIRLYVVPLVIYYADGTIDLVDLFIKGRSLSMKSGRTFRLPLKSTEKVTAACTKSPLTLLATSHGRIMGTVAQIQHYVVNSEINSPIRQLFSVNPDMDPYKKSDLAVMLLYENGSIAYWFEYQKDRTNFVEVKGRFTCIYELKFNGFGLSAGNWRYILAGDMDGNLTVFRVSGGIIKQAKTMKRVVSNKITVISDANDGNLFIGTEMGDYQILDTMQLCEIKYDVKLPLCVSDSRNYYKTAFGWYFLKDDQLCMTTKAGKTTVIKSCFGKKNLKMKYLSCAAVPDREITLTYNQFGYGAQVRDYGKSTKDFLWEMNLKAENKQVRIIKVVLMQSYVLLQYEQGTVELLYIDASKSRCLPLVTFGDVKGTITTAALLENYKEEEEESRKEKHSKKKIAHLMVAYRQGKIGWTMIEWNTKTMTAKVLSSNEIATTNSYMVSMITSQKHLGDFRCISLNNKGIAYISYALQAKTSVYLTGAQQDLSPIIGRGHSLVETSLGILAAGFKQHTLNVCWISMGINTAPQYGYLFSVDTRSSRLPFTLIEEKKQQPRTSRQSTQKVILSYYEYDGIKEKSFPITTPQSFNGVKNSGIITDCHIRNNMTDDMDMQFIVYTGDTDGRFCVWTLKDDDYHIRHQKYYADLKLNGAVTCIHGMEASHLIAVATSQGDLHLYKVARNCFQVFPLDPLELGQKINYLTSYVGRPREQRYLLIFLEDGTVEDVNVMEALTTTTAQIRPVAHKVAQFPVATKMAFSTTLPNKFNDRYLLALGIDGILRRTQRSPIANEIIKMSWKISTIKQDSNVVMVGDPSGWVYVMVSIGGKSVYFEIDCYHKHEIIDILCHPTEDYGIFICSLDITGTVVIRRSNINISKKSSFSKFPVIWTSPVPSPRKLVDISERQIMVVGKGVATKSF